MNEIASKRLHPKHWAPAKGFANGIVAEGRHVFIAGQIGWNAGQQFESDDFVVQVEQALRNIVEVLAEAEGRPEHLVRLNWYVLDKNEYLARLTDELDAIEVHGDAAEVEGDRRTAAALMSWHGAVDGRKEIAAAFDRG